MEIEGYTSTWLDERVSFLRTQMAANIGKCPELPTAQDRKTEVTVEIETIGDEIVDVVLTAPKTSSRGSRPCLEDAAWAIRLDAEFTKAQTFRFPVSI